MTHSSLPFDGADVGAAPPPGVGAGIPPPTGAGVGGGGTGMAPIGAGVGQASPQYLPRPGQFLDDPVQQIF